MPSKFPEDFQLNNVRLQRLIQSGHSEEAVDGYFHHPDQIFGHVFNVATKDVDAKGIDKVYYRTRLQLILEIDVGKIQTFEQLAGRSRRILLMNAMHHRCKTWRRDHPERDGDLLVVPIDVAHCSSHRFESETEEQQSVSRIAELSILFEAEIDSTGLAIFRKVTDFAISERTMHGALTSIAQCIQMDPKGNILKVREDQVVPGKPNQKVVKQVTVLYYRTLTQIIRILESQGINVPVSLTKKLTKRPRKPRKCESTGFDQSTTNQEAA